MKNKESVYSNIVRGENISFESVSDQVPSGSDAAYELPAENNNINKNNNNYSSKGDNCKNKTTNNNDKVNERAKIEATATTWNVFQSFFSFERTKSSRQKIQFSQEEQKYARQLVERDELAVKLITPSERIQTRIGRKVIYNTIILMSRRVKRESEAKIQQALSSVSDLKEYIIRKERPIEWWTLSSIPKEDAKHYYLNPLKANQKLAKLLI